MDTDVLHIGIIGAADQHLRIPGIRVLATESGDCYL